MVYDNGYRSRSFTYRELAGMARAFALRLREQGVRKGNSVLIWSENRPGWIAVLWGCILEGVILVPIDYRASPEFVTKVAGLVEARAMVIGDEVAPRENAWKLAEIEQSSSNGWTPAAQVEAGDIVQIVFTSGSTGEPKGVTITHKNLLANMVPVEREIAKYKKYGRPFFPLRFVNLLPMSHMFGQAMAAYIPPMIAGTVVFLASLRPEEIIRQIRDRRVSVLVCVPKMLEVLRGYVASQFPDSEAADAGAGRWWARWWRFRKIHRAFGFKFWSFVVGAAPLDPRLEEFWSRLGFVVVQGYGLTETAPIVTLNHPFHARRGSVGKPIGGVKVRIAEDGEILVRGPNVTTGYYRNPAADAELFEDGWLRTGDLGRIEPDGNLYVLGRKKDTIVTPDGLNVYPEDVERVLERMPGVKEAAAAGHDRVHAVVVMEPGASAEEAVSQANRELERHQRIHAVSVWPGESLPRTEGTGKLKRAQIRQWLASGVMPAPRAAPDGGLMAALQRIAPGRPITPETSLEELGLSSLERVELMTEIEKLRGGRVDEAAMSEARRVSELLSLESAPAAEPTATAYPRWTRSLPARAFRRVFQPLVILPLTRYYARIRVRGLEHLDALQGPAVFASNHQSHMDTPAILAALPARHRYRIAPAMSKEFFAAHFHPHGRPFGERFKRSLEYYLAALCFNAFPLPQRESGAGEALHYAGELAGEGWSILIYPEGERTNAGELLPFRPGVAMMASRLGLPVVPVRIRGLEKVLHKTARRATRGPVEIAFGRPITPAGQDWRALVEETERSVQSL